MNWKLHDMEDEAEEDQANAEPSSARYPYGLCLCLTEKELESLNLSSEVEIGDYLHGMFFARVTSVSTHSHEGGSGARVEMQITHLALEDETSEGGEKNDEDDY